MGMIPIIRPQKLLSVILKIGFKIIRQKGSHITLEHILYKARKVTVPMHNKDLPIKTLLSILKQAKISLKEFLELLKK